VRYYTKQWYDLMQRLDYCICMKPITDKDYSDVDISALYDKCLKREVARARREYDTPPQYLSIDGDGLGLDDIYIFDHKTGVMKRPDSIEQVKAMVEAERMRDLAEFENRPPFDESEAVSGFEDGYMARLEYEYRRFPEAEISGVDRRLIALGFLPRSVYDRLKAMSKANKREFDAINRAAGRALRAAARAVPKRVAEAFDGLHDADINSIEKVGADVVVTLELCGAVFSDAELDTDDGDLFIGVANGEATGVEPGQPSTRRIVFKSAEIVERDEAELVGGAIWLYDELYPADGGYEAHIMYECDGLKYLTVRCADISVDTSGDTSNGYRDRS
jgi:hypothetical protein